MGGPEEEELYADLFEDLEDGRQLPKTSLLQGGQEEDEEKELYADLFEDLEDGRQLPKTSLLQDGLEEEEEEEEELYADLFEDLEDGRQLPKTSFLQMEERMSQITKQTQDMQTEIDILLKENDSLRQDKDVLIRNISCLFKTAQMELARKNKQINELREEISQLETQEPHPNSLMPTEAQIKTKSEKLLWDSNLNKVQENGCRETRHADTLLEIARLNPYDSNAMKNVSGEESNCQKRLIKFNANDKPHQPFRDARRQKVVEDERKQKVVEDERRSSQCTHSIQDKDSFKGHCENRKEEISFRHDKRERQSQEKLVKQGHDNGKDQQIMSHGKKDRVNYNEFRDYRTSGRRERDDQSFRDARRQKVVEDERKQKVVEDERKQIVVEDERMQKVVDDERRSSRRTHSIQDKDSFKGHCENRKEEISSRHDKRERQSQEKLVKQGHDNGKDQQIMSHAKKDRVNYNEFRDYRTSGRRERDDRTGRRTATIRSMNESDIFSSDVSRVVPRNYGVKRKVADAV